MSFPRAMKTCLGSTLQSWHTNKIQDIIEMTLPKNVKEVQSLNGKVVALNRFVSRATDRCLPFFRMLKKYFKWTIEC